MPDRISAWGIYDVFTVRDGEQIFLAAVSDPQWKVFCEVLGFPDLFAEPAYRSNNDRVRARPALIPLLRERLAGRGAAELAAIFERAGLPYAPIRRPEELLDDPHLLATGDLADIVLPDGDRAGQAVKTTLLPLAMDGARLGVRADPPRFGADTDELLAGVGYTPDEIAALRARHVVA